jgi:predicted nucleic acid-binding Zn ribbon protein
MKSNPRKPSKQAVAIGDILPELLQAYRQEVDQPILRLSDMWETAVGTAIARNSRPQALRGAVLLVHVASSSWSHQLQFSKKALIARINNTLGQPLIDDIRFKVGPTAR